MDLPSTEVIVTLIAYIVIVVFFLWIGGNVNSVTTNATFPWYYPPGWVFGLVWTALFLLFLVVLINADNGTQRYIGLVYDALVLAWTPLFVYSKNYALGFYYLLFVLGCTIWYASYIKSWYLAPQVLWITIATFLAASMYALNG